MFVSYVMAKMASLLIKRRFLPILFVKNHIGSDLKRVIMTVIMERTENIMEETKRLEKNDIIIGTSATKTRVTIPMLSK